MPPLDNRVTAQPVTVDGERRVQITVGLVWAVLHPDEARDLITQISLALKWKAPGGGAPPRVTS